MSSDINTKFINYYYNKLELTKSFMKNERNHKQTLKNGKSKLNTEKSAPITENVPHRIRKQILHFYIFAKSCSVLSFNLLIPERFHAFTCNEDAVVFT